MPLDLIQQSFNSGMWSPRLDGRSDLEKYYSACRLLENFTPTRYGPAERRPGLYYVAEVKDSSKQTRVLPFKYSTVQAYILEVGDEYMRFYKDRGQIITGVGTESLTALDNIVAHWLLNDNLVSAAVLDDDGQDHDGIATANTDALHETGKVGTGCFNLDSQYTVKVGVGADEFSFTNDLADSAFSIACWAFVTQQDDVQVLLSKYRDSALTREWRFSLDASRKLQLHLADTGADLSGDLIAQWKLNETSGTTVDNDEGTAALDGTPANSVNCSALTATSIKANMTPCFDLDGQYAIEIGNDNALTFGDGSNDSALSIAAWVYVTDATVPQIIFSKWDTGNREYMLTLDIQTKLLFYVWDESENAGCLLVTDSAISEGWHFIVITYDGSGGTTAADGMVFYVDGNIEDSTAASIGTYVAMENKSSNAVIGAYYLASTLTYFLADKIDNVMLFGVELTAANVLSLYNDGEGTETMGTAEVSAVSDDALSLGWHFLACTYSAPAVQATAAAGIILYVDGVAVNSTNTEDALYTAMQTGAEEIRIGSQRNADDSANEKFWGDKIDNVAVFSDVLTPTEIASLYSTTPYEISSPYLEADLFGIQRIQSADVMFSFHADYNPRKLLRYYHNIWELEDIAFDWPPFMNENTTSVTITPSATVGTIELTATSPIFTSDHVGSYWLIKHNRTDNAIEKDITSDYSAYAVTGVSDILVDVLGPWNFRTTKASWNATLVLERSYNGILTLVLDAQPAGGDWAVDDIITGATSKDTCIVVSVVDSTHYTIKQLSGSFTDDEVLSNQSGNSRACGATYPRYEGWHTLGTYTSTADQNFNISGEEELGDAYLRIRCSTYGAAQVDIILTCERYYHYGIVKITGFTSATLITATVMRTIGAITATKMWSEGAWSDERGYPAAATFHEERLVAGGTVYEPHNIKGSKTDKWENFRTGTLDDDSVSYSFAANEMNAVRWLISKEVLLLGTAGAEWKLGSFDEDEPLTPGNPIEPRLQTSYGSKNIQAIMLANVVLFVQQEGRVVRGAQYVFEKGESGGYDAIDYSIMAEHITESGIVSMAYQQQPEPTLWCVLNNGYLIGMVFEPGQKVWGWFRVVTDGDFEDVAVIPGIDEDEVWVVVNRTINGATKRYIEYFKPRDCGSDQKDCFFVDSGLSWDGGDAVTITGITSANPVVVTVDTYPTDGDGNDLADGDQIRIRYVGGMSEVNNKVFTISNPDTTAKTFELRDKLDTVDVNSTDFTTFATSITGDTIYDSVEVKNVSAADVAKLALGAPISGTGIPTGTTVETIEDDYFTMSNFATVTGTDVTITIGGTVEQVANTFYNLGHLEAKTVSVLGDGTVHADVVVSSALVTLTDYFNKVHIGLRYISKLKPMKLETPTRTGTARAKIKRIHSIIFSFYKSLGCTFGIDDATETIPFRDISDAMGKAVPLFTGEKKMTFPGGYELSGDIYVEQKQPLPLTMRSITPRLQIYE